MELALIRTLLDKDFYEDHKGIRTPDKLFTKEVRKIKNTLDYAMQQYDKDITPAELEALFFTRNVLTTSNKDMYKDLFRKMGNLFSQYISCRTLIRGIQKREKKNHCHRLYFLQY